MKLTPKSKLKQLVLVGACLLGGGSHAQESLTLRKIQETGIVTIGYRDGAIPFSYLDKRRQPVGYSIDICMRIVDAIKDRLKLRSVEVRFVPVTSANRISVVTNDIVDIECGTTTNTAERQKRVAFTVTTYVAASSLVSKKTSDIRSIEDLRGKVIVSTAGTTYIDALTKLRDERNLEMKIVSGRDHAESFRMVETDRADAFAMDDVLLYGLVANASNPSAYTVQDVSLATEPYGMVLRKNDEQFKKLADQAITGLFRSGEITKIYDKWFQSPIPNNQINLRLPMSAALKKAIAQPTDSSAPASYR